MTTESFMIGYPPTLKMGAGNPEAQKYGKLWELPQYRQVAPGEELASVFLQQAHPKPGARVIDFGCGTGRGALMLAIVGKMNVTMIDFVRNCLDPEIRQACETQAQVLRFVKADLEYPLPVTEEYGFCTDVMEHIPTDKVDQVLDNVLQAAQHVFFAIATTDDVCGKLIGETLHLTVKPYAWWLEQFTKRECLIHWSQEVDGAVLFYVSAWKDVTAVVDGGKLNTPDEAIRENVRVNCAAGWQQVQPHSINEMEVMILGGGPSLSTFEEDIEQKRAEGVKLITLNGAYNWALEHGLTPSAQIIVDARPFNARFTKPVVDGCKYLIASQCDPSVFDGLPKERTFIWHTMLDMIADLVKPRYDPTWPIPSCTTVLNTSIPLLRMLGFTRFHLYGCDSCLAKDKMQHHVYAQPENDSQAVIPVKVTGGRIFWCHPWMAAQAQQFIELIKFLGDEVDIAVYGDGLLKHILDAGADASVAQLEGET
jgi:2-polyprenyl-3-methyl-5-hydroxy-6-metoxy-1,4-benzoquinol methylase